MSTHNYDEAERMLSDAYDYAARVPSERATADATAAWAIPHAILAIADAIREGNEPMTEEDVKVYIAMADALREQHTHADATEARYAREDTEARQDYPVTGPSTLKAGDRIEFTYKGATYSGPLVERGEELRMGNFVIRRNSGMWGGGISDVRLIESAPEEEPDGSVNLSEHSLSVSEEPDEALKTANELKAALEAERAKVHGLTRERTNAPERKRVRDLEAKVDTLGARLGIARKERDEAERKSTAAAREKRLAVEALEAAQAEVERLTADEEGLTRAAREHIASESATPDPVAQDRERLGRERNDLRAEVELLTDDRDRWKAVSKDHRRVIDSRGEQIVSLTERNVELQDEVERLTRENDAFYRMLNSQTDPDGNALVTVREDDLRTAVNGLLFEYTSQAFMVRLRRACDERGEGR